MSAATDGLLKTIAWLHPEYAPLIAFIQQHQDQIAALGPVIQAAITEGPGALAAAEKAAPDLAKAIRDFVAVSPMSSAVPKVSTIHAENVTRKIFGASPLSDTEQATWWANSTGS